VQGGIAICATGIIRALGSIDAGSNGARSECVVDIAAQRITRSTSSWWSAMFESRAAVATIAVSPRSDLAMCGSWLDWLDA
jgi:hypothetical protein